MKISNELYMLKMHVVLSGKDQFLYPSVIKDENSLVLIDTGVGGENHLADLTRLFDSEGLPFSKLDTIILTHQDFDHIGGLHSILEAFESSVEVYFHEDERGYIVGDKELIKGGGKKMPSLVQLLLKKMGKEKPRTVEEEFDIKVIRILKDGDLLPFGGGLRVIHTPGHTPGNICLYHEKSKTLIAGDTLNIFDGELSGPNPIFTPDMNLAMLSLEKLLDYDIENVICYHGGFYDKAPHKRLLKIIDDFRSTND
ncbi:MBL fold metallo-hydrolase [Alkalibacter mobilis]|uniref:MBL fold metallo-hydrolase n=1 Tax=Alkalibacter mobilis TaxID=2787712 RepID=UPI0018A00EA6|nr:MBL fold metallo-hydrolase [Alkalibacter mobilis]MBF7095733.1 MBL fold metallo-hydrolase [Alkalibacter mobilis]